MRRNNSWLTRVAERFALLAGARKGIGAGVRSLRQGEFDPIDPETRFETGDVRTGAALLGGAGVIVVLWATVLLTYPVYSYFAHARAASSPPPVQAAAHGTPQSPQPRIQADPARDWKDFHAYEEQQLNGYHWVDRAHGSVSIPIDEAIKIVAARGIPPQPSSGAYFDPQQGSRETGFAGKVEPR